jgi:peptidoglycan/LPS O-acetylase OafA/YrhL
MENLTGQTDIALPSHIPQFDGPRGLAILTVFIFHSKFNLELQHESALQCARTGVCLFFVLAGFLITGILLDGKGSWSYFRNSCVRRALGIWHLFWLILAVALIGLPFTPEGGWNMVLRKYSKSKSEITAQAARHEFSIRFPRETP